MLTPMDGSDSASEGGAGAGLPGRPMGTMSMSFRYRLLVMPDRSGHRGGGERAGDFHIGVDAHRDVIVAQAQHVLGGGGQVQGRLGELHEIHLPAEVEFAAADFAVEPLESQLFLSEGQPRVKVADRRHGDIFGARGRDV